MGRYSNLKTNQVANLPGMRGFVGFSPAGPRLKDCPDSITIVLELPSKYMLANRDAGNSRLAAMLRAKDVKKHRRAALLAASLRLHDLQAAAPIWMAATIHAVFYFSTRRRRDRDNLVASLKHYLDGLADAGLVENDRGFATPIVSEEIDSEVPRVQITVTKA